MRPISVALALLLSVAAQAQPLKFRTLAGTTTGGGYLDGPARSARFSIPSGSVVCGGMIYIADSGNHTIRRFSADGEVTTWAGAGGEPGSTDGNRTAARFRFPSGVAADAQCNLFVSDRGNHTVRRISASGDVTTVAGQAGSSGAADGTAGAARFNTPQDIAVAPDGTIWIADNGNQSVRFIGSDGRVRTILTPGRAPFGIAVDANGAAFVSDHINHAVLRITREGEVRTIASSRTLYASDAAVGPDGLVYVTNYNEHLVQRIASDGTVTTVAGMAALSGSRDGREAEARLDHPRGISFDPSSGTMIFVDEFTCVVRRLTTGGEVTTIGGTAAAPSENRDGPAEEARFENATELDVDADGVAWVADLTTIRRVARDGFTTTIAGAAGQSEFRDGNRIEARFRGASGIAVEPSGTLVVIDGNTVRRVTKDGQVTTIAGSPTESGDRDGAGSAARFNFLTSITVAPDGTIYVADAFNQAIKRITGDNVTTLLKSPNFAPPMGGLDVDGDGNVYLWNENVPAIFKITPAGSLSAIAVAEPLNTLMNGLALAPDGTFYIGGFRRQSIYRLAPGSSVIERFAGDDFAIGNQNGTPAEARFRSPARLDVGPDGRLFVRDANRAIRVGSIGDPPQVSFDVQATAIKPGESATLSWTVSDGTVTIDQSIGSVSTSGTVTVSPSRTTTYTLIASNAAGDTRKTVTVFVTGSRRHGVRR